MATVLDVTLYNRETNLSELEYKLLKVWFDTLENGAKTIDVLVCDNYSWKDTKTLAEDSGLSVHQVSGLISSLVKKGIVTIEEDDLFYIDESYLEKLPQDLEFSSL